MFHTVDSLIMLQEVLAEERLRQAKHAQLVRLVQSSQPRGATHSWCWLTKRVRAYANVISGSVRNVVKQRYFSATAPK